MTETRRFSPATTARILMLTMVVAFALVPTPPSHGAAKTTYTFDECDEGWTVEEFSAEPTPTSMWHRAEPGDGGGMAFYNGPPYASGDSETTLTSPVHKWGGGKVTVTFSIKYNYEPAATRAVEEGIHLEWTGKDGFWTQEAFFGETNAGYPNFEQQKVSFKAPRGPLQIRFKALSDALVSFLGGAVDTVSLPVAKPKSAGC